MENKIYKLVIFFTLVLSTLLFWPEAAAAEAKEDAFPQPLLIEYQFPFADQNGF